MPSARGVNPGSKPGKRNATCSGPCSSGRGLNQKSPRPRHGVPPPATVRARASRRASGLGGRGHLGENPGGAVRPGLGKEHGVEQDGVDLGRQVGGHQRAAPDGGAAAGATAGQAHAEGAPGQPQPHPVKRAAGGVAIGSQIEDAKVPGPLDGHDQVGVRFVERCDSQYEIAGSAWRWHVLLPGH
jgi:hypothetical protein